MPAFRPDLGSFRVTSSLTSKRKRCLATHGLDRDPRSPALAALSAAGDPAGGADEEERVWPADGDRRELQQAAVAPHGLLRTTVHNQ